MPFALQLRFVALVLAIGRLVRALRAQWPRWLQLVPGCTVGALAAVWTLQRRHDDCSAVVTQLRTRDGGLLLLNLLENGIACTVDEK